MHHYLVAALAVWALAPMPLATRVHGRWLEDRWPALSTLHVYSVVLGLLVLGGTVLLGHGVFHDGPWYGLVVGVPLGLLLGRVAQFADRKISRAFVARARAAAGRLAPRHPGPAPARGGVARPVGLAARASRPVGLAARGTAQSARQSTVASTATRANRWTARERDRETRVGLGVLLAGAVLEEAVFRGVLGRMALDAPGVAGTALAVLAVAAFCLSHLPFGWPQVLAKLPLSLLAMATVLLTGGIAAAVVSHVLFNWNYWRYQRALGTTGSG
ncbi:CPBP family intramembrane glutamic endopeptidase [Streptomyces sioyaensis]|uniref:CPBP family intramembrane glutamic endopeptidase n=1 Tax=Streptomyces sioyaensis TaxID=67364 RepID=UPI00340BFC2E